MINSSKSPTLLQDNAPRDGSPGQNNPAVAAYDPSGLRSSMTANWTALDKSLQLNAAPDHLPKPEWFDHMEEIQKECERKGIPLVIGRKNMYVPDSYNKIKW